MSNTVQSISLDKLIAHPDNPNTMSKSDFAKLARNIERSGQYEPLIIRPQPGRSDCFQIINGHHRRRALAQLGYTQADCIIWNLDDEQTDILLATLNRLCGSDELDKKLVLLKRLSKKMEFYELAKLLPQTAKQIERLVNLKMPTVPAKINANVFACPLVFFADNVQQQIIEDALSLAGKSVNKKTRAEKRIAALTHIARYFIDNYKHTSSPRLRGLNVGEF